MNRTMPWPKLLLVLASTLLIIVTCTVLTPDTLGAFSARISNQSNTAGMKRTDCRTAIRGTSGLIFGYQLNSTSPADLSSNNNAGQSGKTTVQNVQGGCLRDTIGIMNFTGAVNILDLINSPHAWNSIQTTAPNSYSQEVWFRTSSAQGTLLGFTNTQRFRSESIFNRLLYINSSGQLMAGTSNTGLLNYSTVTSPSAVTDGKWHHTIVTRDAASNTLRMYLDGAQVATFSGSGSPELYAGYWRLGCAQQTTWPGGNLIGKECFKGDMQFAAAYNRVLTPSEVQAHFLAGAA